MDNLEDEARFTSNPNSSNRSRKAPVYAHPVHPQYNYDYVLNDAVEENEDDDDEFDEEEDYNTSVRYANAPANFTNQSIEDDFNRYPKRQKRVKTLASDYELVPRRLYENNVNFSSNDWSDHEKFMLLEIWGDRFLQLGRNSLRSEDWVEVAEKVSELSKINRNEAQCKLLLDSLKRKYKKEKAKCGGSSSKWPYFRKIEALMNREFGGSGSGSGGSGGNGFGLACGVDSGEFVFMDTNVYLERANGNDEMRDSPCESEEEEGEGAGRNEGMKGLRVLADSVHKFGEIYEKIESTKREQMLELERMRVEFEKELDLQKKQILERAHAEIVKIREGEDDDDDDSDEDDDLAEDASE
ncbi:trihelix transcription factor ASIL2 [Mercurialis annua]|uniref:trihelix transcription factor ASIL2 n=1 Tax=Mercurialis annua TaxID=3986 RepID=UPI00215E340F|nr:trihelix transcription factor ASIL2 [Mercurialis annua]